MNKWREEWRCAKCGVIEADEVLPSIGKIQPQHRLLIPEVKNDCAGWRQELHPVELWRIPVDA